MFVAACSSAREAIYGVMALSQTAPHTVNCSTGTAFMISPGHLATAAHLCHVETDISKPAHSRFEVIRGPDIGRGLENATLVAEDPERDVAILRIEAPRSNALLPLLRSIAPVGSPCGSLGFPLASVQFTQHGRTFNLLQRFQGASISAYHTQTTLSGRVLPWYETDSLMYKGSSGCPGFLESGQCFGMHVRSLIETPPGAGGTGPLQRETRLAISLWVPSDQIAAFAAANGVGIPE